MEAPPLLTSDAPPPLTAPDRVPLWRLSLAWVLLASYPLLIAAMHSSAGAADANAPILPDDIRGLLLLSVENLGLFAVLWLLCWWLGRPNATELRLDRLPNPVTWLMSFGYSIAIRFLAAAPIIVILLYNITVKGEKLGDQLGLRSKVENVIGIAALADPLYLLLTITLISFVVAGMREELWRAGVLAMGERLLPARWSPFQRGALVVTVSAVIFGCGHLQQGPVGVAQTTILGVALGSMILFHRSTWLAVLAHGFFDATTFLMLRMLKDSGELEKLLHK